MRILVTDGMDKKALATLRELGIQDKSLLKPVAAGCTASPGSYRRMDPDEIYQIFQEAF